MERRKATRYRVRAPSFYCWQRADGTLQEAQGTSRDISDRGVFILAQELPPAGAHLQLEVHLPAVAGASTSAHLHGEGTVVRTGEPRGEHAGFAAAVLFHTEISADDTVLGPEKIQ
jgi:hypothetical protein